MREDCAINESTNLDVAANQIVSSDVRELVPVSTGVVDVVGNREVVAVGGGAGLLPGGSALVTSNSGMVGCVNNGGGGCVVGGVLPAPGVCNVVSQNSVVSEEVLDFRSSLRDINVTGGSVTININRA